MGVLKGEGYLHVIIGIVRNPDAIFVYRDQSATLYNMFKMKSMPCFSCARWWLGRELILSSRSDDRIMPGCRKQVAVRRVC